MKNTLLHEVLVCPHCGSELEDQGDQLECAACGHRVPVQDGIPLFTPTPESIQAWERVERGPNQGTPWRREIWHWLHKRVQTTTADSLFLDVGSGHGDFQEIFSDRRYIAVDIVPYPEVDITCDLTQTKPFRPSVFDVIVMMNVLEHVFKAEQMLTRVRSLLKPGGEVWIAVPFLLKVHQAPHDFKRYTHFALRQMASDAGFVVKELIGYYDPIHQVNDTLGNLWAYALPPRAQPRGLAARLLVFLVQLGINILGLLLPKVKSIEPESTSNPASLGYLAVFQNAE